MLKRCRGVVALRSRALRQQCATARVATTKRAAAGVVGALWRGGGWRRWSHKAEARWARRWRRICEAAVRARRGEGKGLVRTLLGAVETGVAENEEYE